MELCLRVPMYTLLRDGVNRSLARAAFRDCVPIEIIRRESKAGGASNFMSQVRRSLPFIRELLLDGILVRERIVIRSALEAHFSSNRPTNIRTFWPVLTCIIAEIWARKWNASGWRVEDSTGAAKRVAAS
jgi:asparagine synthase (glutamine-hydrolysing)